MNSIIGFARIMARSRVEQLCNKPIFGKPYLKQGQGLALWGNHFQIGAVLGAKHRDQLDAFGTAFLGAQGEPGAVSRYFTDLVVGHLKDSLNDTMTVTDYVTADVLKRVGHSGDMVSYLKEHGMDKLKCDTAEEVAWQFAERGAALGAVYPDMARKMIEQTHKAVPEERWEQYHAAGLDVPKEQDVLGYGEIEDGEELLFMAYCKECCPGLHVILSQ